MCPSNDNICHLEANELICKITHEGEVTEVTFTVYGF